MKDRLEQIKAQALEQIKASDMPEKLNEVRVKFLGKKGELTAVLKGMKDVAPEERPKVGQLVNETRAAIEELLEETKVKMEAAIREEKMKAEVIDVTLPSKKSTVGHRHPNTIALEEVERIFVGMGYEVAAAQLPVPPIPEAFRPAWNCSASGGWSESVFPTEGDSLPSQIFQTMYRLFPQE